MLKNRHLSKAIAEQNFYCFRSWLIYKCSQIGIEIRVAIGFTQVVIYAVNAVK